MNSSYQYGCRCPDAIGIQPRGRLTAGVNHPDIQNKLLLKQDRTFADARAIGKQPGNVSEAIDE